MGYTEAGRTSMATGQTSIRLESELLRALDDLAKQRGMSRTEVMEKAIQAFLQAGGEQTIAGAMLPAGFTPAFENWLASITEKTGAITVAILALDLRARIPVIYSGVVQPFAARQARESGTVQLQLFDERAPTQLIVVPIPRGLILGWETQNLEVTRDRMMIFWGAADGNALARAIRAPSYR
jgi:hypothetical protein